MSIFSALTTSSYSFVFSRPHLVQLDYWYALSSVCRLSVVCNVYVNGTSYGVGDGTVG